MTPKEKAKQLILKFAFKGAQHEGEAENFALIAVDEIIKSNPMIEKYPISYSSINYWQEVKKEIEKL